MLWWFASVAWGGCLVAELKARQDDMDEALLGDWSDVPARLDGIERALGCVREKLDWLTVQRLHTQFAIAAHAFGDDELAAKHLLAAWLIIPSMSPFPEYLPANAPARARFFVLQEEVLATMTPVPAPVQLRGARVTAILFPDIPTIVQDTAGGRPELLPPAAFPKKPTRK